MRIVKENTIEAWIRKLINSFPEDFHSLYYGWVNTSMFGELMYDLYKQNIEPERASRKAIEEFRKSFDGHVFPYEADPQLEMSITDNHSRIARNICKWTRLWDNDRFIGWVSTVAGKPKTDIHSNNMLNPFSYISTLAVAMDHARLQGWCISIVTTEYDYLAAVSIPENKNVTYTIKASTLNEVLFMALLYIALQIEHLSKTSKPNLCGG